MRTLVIGSRGNMGRRYTAILRHLGADYMASDLGFETTLEDDLKACDNVIIATPTDSHHQVILQVCLSKPPAKHIDILCEKPIVKNIVDLEGIYDEVSTTNCTLYCVNQYNYAPSADIFRETEGDTSYDYYNTGKDGAIWDCFQIFGMATGRVEIKTDSPVWQCKVNAWQLRIEDMDGNYVRMIKDFLGSQQKLWGRRKVIETTKKVIAAL